jgi:hypothetical protein
MPCRKIADHSRALILSQLAADPARRSRGRCHGAAQEALKEPNSTARVSLTPFNRSGESSLRAQAPRIGWTADSRRNGAWHSRRSGTGDTT